MAERETKTFSDYVLNKQAACMELAGINVVSDARNNGTVSTAQTLLLVGAGFWPAALHIGVAEST